MTVRLLSTKFHIPACRTAEVSRPRLLNLLDTGLLERRKLALVSAPAGYGKTTLVSQWLHSLNQAEHSIGWLSLDQTDSEPERFLAYFLAAFQRAHETLGEKLQPFIDLPQLPSPQHVLDELINELVALDGSILIVLEDYHRISNPAVHEALEYFLDHQPAGVHLVFTTRQDPPLPLPRLRARGQLTEIRAMDLRFTLEEARRFLLQSTKADLVDQAASLLEERTEGWAVGLQLAGLALQNSRDPERFLRTFHGSHRYVLDYLAEEVLRQQGEAVESFLIQTGVLDQFNADLCCALTGRRDAQAVIERLEKANLFVVPLDDECIWYRYHHLFQDYLLTLLARPEQESLYKKASAWHEANELMPEAVRYALASGDSEFSAGVIERAINRNTTWSSGNITLLSSWLEALPADAITARPNLCLHASRIHYLASQYDLAERHIEQAEAALRNQPETPETEKLLALAALYRGSLACVRGDVQQALEQTEYARARIPTENHLAHARAFFNLGHAFEGGGELERSVENYLQSSEAARLAGVHFLSIQARCCAAQIMVRQGRLAQAEQACQEAVRLVSGARIPPLGLAHIVLGIIALERNELVSAVQLLKDGVSLSREGGLLDNAVTGMAALARLHASQGNAAAAKAAAQEAQAILETISDPRLSLYAGAYQARLQLYLGMEQEAIQWAAGYQARRGVSASEYEDLVLARVLLAEGQSEQIPALLHLLYQTAEKEGRNHTCIEAALLLCLYHAARKEAAAAADWLNRSLDLAAPEGYLRIFLDEGARLLELLPRTRSTNRGIVDALLEQIQPQTGPGAAANARLPEPLSEQELRVLDLIVAGKSNQEIAAALFISVGTAKWHVHNILQKLGVNNRPQAIARALETGLKKT